MLQGLLEMSQLKFSRTVLQISGEVEGEAFIWSVSGLPDVGPPGAEEYTFLCKGWRDFQGRGITKTICYPGHRIYWFTKVNIARYKNHTRWVTPQTEWLLALLWTDQAIDLPCGRYRTGYFGQDKEAADRHDQNNLLVDSKLLSVRHKVRSEWSSFSYIHQHFLAYNVFSHLFNSLLKQLRLRGVKRHLQSHMTKKGQNQNCTVNSVLCIPELSLRGQWDCRV